MPDKTPGPNPQKITGRMTGVSFNPENTDCQLMLTLSDPASSCFVLPNAGQFTADGEVVHYHQLLEWIGRNHKPILVELVTDPQYYGSVTSGSFSRDS